MSGSPSLPSIRVADAPLLHRPGARPATPDERSEPEERSGYATGLRAAGFIVLMMLTVINFSSYLLVPELTVPTKILVLVRYMLWPLILTGFILHVARHGGDLIWKAFLPFALFFLVGVVSGLFGALPVESMRLLVFWIFGVIAATSIGLEVRQTKLYRMVVYAFLLMIGSSLIFARLDPALAFMTDLRSEAGVALRGLFPGKNQFGLISVYGVLFALTTRSASMWIRIVTLALSFLALMLAKSQGASLVAGVVVVYAFCLPWLCRQPIPGPIKSLIIFVSIGLVAVAIVIVLPMILGLLGRDASMSGRADVWPVWLARATENWLIGAGPGSFTSSNSPITTDLAAEFANLGAIHSPHNMFIATFGETGIVGLSAFVLPLLWMIAVVPFKYQHRQAQITSMIAFAMALGGISETREVFGLGMNMFLLLLSYATLTRELQGAAGGPAAAQGAPTGAAMVSVADG